MKKRLLILNLVLSIFLLTMASISAEIYYTAPPEETYNFGEIINIGLNVDPVLEEFLLKVDLMCDENFVIQFNVMPDSQGNANIKLPLNFHTIQEDFGDSCYFFGEYSDHIRKSDSFKISNKLEVLLDMDTLSAKPGEKVEISGSARRLNGKGIDGEVEIIIPLLNLIQEDLENLGGEIEEIEEENNETVIEEIEEENNETVIEEIEEEIVEETIEEGIEEEITVSDNGIFYGRIVDGKFSVVFNLSRNIPAGNYRVDVFAYEKDSSGEKTSEGIEMINLEIPQILVRADIALSNQNLNPGDEFSFKPLLIDQAGLPIYNKVSIIIRDEISNRIFERIMDSEEFVDYNIQTNMSSGYYEIEVSSGEISAIKKFYVNEKEIISFRLGNETLIVTNIGNMPYNKDIQIELNGKPFVRKVDLEVGEQQKFRLTGDGETDIKASDGETDFNDRVTLTGYVAGIESIKENASIALSTPMIWIVIIIILGAGTLFLFKNVLKKKSFAYPIKDKLRISKKPKVVKLGEKKIESKSGTKKESETKDKSKEKKESIVSPGALVAPNHAEQVLVLKGQKNKVAVLVLKIKNKISKTAKQSLEKAIEPVYSKRGAIYEQGDYIFIIFSPLMTRSFKNEIEATKAAEKIVLILKEHNKKSKDKIEFGIGVNSGDMINKVEDKKLKFTAMGNLMIVAKKLAGASDEQILLTKEAFEKGIHEIKAEKREVDGLKVYEARRVINSEKNQKFIDGFLKRLGKEGKK